MPKPRLVQVQPIQAWSYSRFQNYEQCPAKAKFLYVDRLKEPDSPSGVHGTRVHALAALVATGKLPAPDQNNTAFMTELKQVLKSKQLPTELETFEDEFAGLRKAKVICEAEWAFTKEWEVTDWFARNTWLRVKVDAHYLETKKNGALRQTKVIIIDHKTGKINDDHALQRSLYALGAFLVYPDAIEVEAAHWYLDQGHEARESWHRNQLEALKEEWLKRTKAMLNDTTFHPTPGGHCRWCHFRKGNGGPCIY